MVRKRKSAACAGKQPSLEATTTAATKPSAVPAAQPWPELAQQSLAAYVQFLRELAKLLTALADPNPAVHQAASVALQTVGRPAVPALIHELRRERSPEELVRLIRLIEENGPGAVYVLSQSLEAQLGPIHEQAPAVRAELMRVLEANLPYSMQQRHGSQGRPAQPPAPPDWRGTDPGYRRLMEQEFGKTSIPGR